MRPFVVETQIIPGATVEADIDSMAGRRPPAALVESAPGVTVRSGLIDVQCAPPSVVDTRLWKPTMSWCWFHGAQISGCDCPARSLLAGSVAGLTLIHCSPAAWLILMIPKPVL